MARGTDTGSYAYKWAREQEQKDKEHKQLILEALLGIISKADSDTRAKTYFTYLFTVILVLIVLSTIINGYFAVLIPAIMLLSGYYSWNIEHGKAIG